MGKTGEIMGIEGRVSQMGREGMGGVSDLILIPDPLRKCS